MDKTVLIVCKKTFLLEMTQKKSAYWEKYIKNKFYWYILSFFSPFLVCLLDISVLNSKLL